MTPSAQNILSTFEALDALEKHQVAIEILRRSLETGELPYDAFHELATDIFRRYDTEESSKQPKTV